MADFGSGRSSKKLGCNVLQDMKERFASFLITICAELAFLCVIVTQNKPNSTLDLQILCSVACA